MKKYDKMRCFQDVFDENLIFSETNLDGIITRVSSAFCDICGYLENELVGNTYHILRHSDMSSTTYKDLWTTIKNQKTWVGEIKNKKKDGSFYLVSTKIKPEFNEDGENIGYYAVYHDITAQKELEALKCEFEKRNLILEKQADENILEVIQLNKELRETQKDIIFTMGSIGESRSKETAFHVKRVAEYSKLLALHTGINEFAAEMLKQASPMHDIGKIGIPDTILNKSVGLTDAERAIMNTHAKLGYEMLNHSDKQLLQIASILAYEHHEKYDGSGYPRGLKGDEIHIYGRITAIADVFDALGSSRVYKKAWDDEKIWNHFKDESGKHFDPVLVEIFFNHLDDFLEVRDKFKEDGVN